MAGGTSVDRLFFELGIDPSGMRTGAAKAQGIFGSLSKRAKITIGVLGGFSVVFAAIGAKSVAAASKFQDAFNEVRTLIDETTTDSKALRREVLKLSAAVGRPPDEVSRGLYQVISAGVTDAAEAMDVLEVATRASIGGLTDQFTAVDAVTTVLNAYNLEASEAEHVTDLMLNAVKEGKLTFSDLAANIGLVVTTAAQAGVGFDEVSAALASMTKAGLSTEIAVTALNNLILRIVVPQDEAAAAAKRMGVQFGEAALKSEGLIGIMTKMSKAADGSITKFAEMLPEIRGMRAGTVLAGSGFEEFTRIMETTQNVAGTTTEFFNKVKQSMSETAKEISARLNVAFIKLGSKIIPSIIRTMEGLLDLLDRFTKTDIERQIDALDKIAGTEALVRRLQLTERIEAEEKKQIVARERLNQLFKDGGQELQVHQNISLKTGTIINDQVKSEREIISALLEIAQGKEGIIKLTELEKELQKTIDDERIVGAEALAVHDDRALKFAQDQRQLVEENIAKVRALLLLLMQEGESNDIIAKANREILALLEGQDKETKKKAAADVVAEKSITVQQDELKEKIQLIEMGAASEIALIEVIGLLEKTQAGIIKAEIADINRLTAARLSEQLSGAIKTYGAESEFVKQLRIAIAKLKLEAEGKIIVTLETNLVLRGIDKSSRAVAGLSRELLGLSSTSELTIRRIGDMAGGMLDMQRAFGDTESDLLDKFLPALGLLGTGISIFKSVFDNTKSATDALAESTRQYEERLRRLKDAIDAQVGLQDLNEQAQLVRKLKSFGAFTFKDVFGEFVDPEILRRFAAGENLSDLIEEFFGEIDEAGDFIIQPAGLELQGFLSNLSAAGVSAFFELQNLISSALEDGFISDEEARAIDAAIAQFASFTGALTSMTEEAFDTLIEIENLTDSLIRLADAAAAAAEATDGTVVDSEVRRAARRARVVDPMDSQLPRRRRIFGRTLRIADDDLMSGEDIARQGATRDFRQFVGITEIQGNVLLGILNTSLDVQRRQLDFFMNSFAGIGNIGTLTIGQFTFEANFGNVSLASDQDIAGVSEQLANETIRALRSVGARG